MNLYLCILLILLFTLIDCFLHLSESAVTAANISRIKQLEDVVSKLIYMNYRGIKVSSVARDADELYLTITYDGANDDTIESFFAKKCIYPIYKIFAK